MDLNPASPAMAAQKDPPLTPAGPGQTIGLGFGGQELVPSTFAS
jgi:hypothetical protein